MKEYVSNEMIKLYIDKLIAVYGLYPMVNETALHIQFEHGLYAECVFEIMGKMGLNNRVKVTCYADYKYPCQESAARIIMPQSLPPIGTASFRSMLIAVEMRDSIKNQFYSFISSIAHELSHLVMHGTKHELYRSEIATDLCMLVFGFSNFVLKGKNMIVWTTFGNKSVTLGYLSTDQLQFAIDYINQLQRTQIRKELKPQGNTFKDFFRKLI